jgi:hypothetical protein
MPIGYYSASEVLTDEMVADVLNALGTSQKITFGASGSTLNKSEKRLPEKLVHRVRSYLDKRGLLTRRIVWFDRQKSHIGDKAVAVKLVSRGYPRQLVAMVMGYDPITLNRWGIDPTEQPAPAISMDPAMAESIGKSRLAAVAPDMLPKASTAKLQLIGQCMTELLALVSEPNAPSSRKEK